RRVRSVRALTARRARPDLDSPDRAARRAVLRVGADPEVLPFPGSAPERVPAREKGRHDGSELTWLRWRAMEGLLAPWHLLIVCPSRNGRRLRACPVDAPHRRTQSSAELRERARRNVRHVTATRPSLVGPVELFVVRRLPGARSEPVHKRCEHDAATLRRVEG